MRGRLAGVGVGLVMLTWLPSAVYSQEQAQKETQKETEVTLIGCVELERDYRARKEAGRGGVLGSGVGVGNEFVLTNAKPPVSRRAGSSAAPAGDYELTGRHERDFLRHVGRQVEVVGTIEKNDDGIDRIDVSIWHPVGDYCPAAK